MSHPVIIKTAQLILAGDLVGAEYALTTLADEEGDDALVAVMDEIAPKDLLAIMRNFDGAKESVVNMVVTPEQFARAVVLEARYKDRTHAALHGMMNAVLFREEELTADYLEAIGETDGGYEALTNYFGERDEELLAFAMTGEFTDEMPSDHGLASRSITWLNEKIDEIDEALHEGNAITSSRPKVARSDIADHDWMETAWVLRHELPDIFEQIVIALRDRMTRRIELLSELASDSAPSSTPQSRPATPGYDQGEEESAL